MSIPTTPPNISTHVSTPTPSPHQLPPPFTQTQPPPTLFAQGAEALLYRTHFLLPSHPCALKYRPSKPWRHPTLDARLTRHRILAEARILVKARREGVKVPGVLALDWEGGAVGGGEKIKGGDDGSHERRRSGGWMMMEWIEGATIRRSLDEWLEARKARSSSNDGGNETSETEQKTIESLQPAEKDEQLIDLMRRIGFAVGKLHSVGIVHGDLTTSNLMLRPTRTLASASEDAAAEAPGHESHEGKSLGGEVVLIDFGLAVQSVQDEDKAVDLYVLERAYGSTHPTLEALFKVILDSYGDSYKGGKVVLKRLEDVRMRGRKKSMLG